MSNLLFLTQPDFDLSADRYEPDLFTYMPPSSMKPIPVSNTLISKFEQIGVTQRRRKSRPIVRLEYSYDSLTSYETQLIRDFFHLDDVLNDQSIVFEKGSFWLPIWRTDYLILGEISETGPNPYWYRVNNIAGLQPNDYVMVLNHHFNYDLRIIENVEHDLVSNILRISFLDETNPYATKLNYEVLGVAGKDPWGTQTKYPDLAEADRFWFPLNMYPLIKARLYEKPTIEEEVSGKRFGQELLHNINLAFEQDLIVGI